MSMNLVVYINDGKRLEFDRGRPLPGQVRNRLEALELELDRGVDLPQGRIETPTTEQKAHFAIEQLLNQLARASDDSAATLWCAYVATRLPELVAIRVTETADNFEVSLQFG